MGTSLASWKPSQGKSAVGASPPLLPPQSSPSVPGPGAERGSSTTSPEKLLGRHRLEAWAVLLQVETPARRDSEGERAGRALSGVGGKEKGGVSSAGSRKSNGQEVGK